MAQKNCAVNRLTEILNKSLLRSSQKLLMLSIERCYQSRQVLFNFLLINDTVVREFNFKWKPYRKKQVEANENIFTESLKMHEKKTKSNFEIKSLAADTKKTSP